MAQITTTDFKPGIKVEMDGQPFVIVTNEFCKPGKGQAFNRVRFKHLLTGRTVDKTLKSGEKLDLADVHEANMRMLYRESEGIIFMDDKTFEQIKISTEHVGDADQWMLEDQMYIVLFYNGIPVAVQPPTFMEIKIIRCDPGDRGNTASGRVLKPAEIESGAKIQVPLFVEEGEIVKVDTRTGEYVSRVS